MRSGSYPINWAHMTSAATASSLKITVPAKTGDGLKGPSPSPATMPSTSTRCDLWGVSAMDPSGRANLRIRATSRAMRHAVSFPAHAPPIIPCCPIRASRKADFPTILVALPSRVCGAAYDRSEISDASDRSGFPRGCSSPRPCLSLIHI